MRMWRAILLISLLGLASAFEDKTIPQYLADNGFTTLASTVTALGLDTALSGVGPFTVFAPTEAAFTKLGADTINSLSSAQLSAIVKYHVIQEFLLIPMVASPTSKVTLEGQALQIEPAGGTLRLNNVSMVSSTGNDIIVNNGIIQPIDTVLLPPQLASDSITQILLRDDTRFKDLFLALLIAGLTDTLDQGDFTLFAPTDAAFAVYKDNLLSPEAPNAQAVYQEVLKYHVVPGGRRAKQLSDGQSLFTLHGTPVNVTIDARGVLINQATVIDADILATNGIVHAIDQILVPADIATVAQG